MVFRKPLGLADRSLRMEVGKPAQAFPFLWIRMVVPPCTLTQKGLDLLQIEPQCTPNTHMGEAVLLNPPVNAVLGYVQVLR
jgi:hypothetical protein